uniref:Uncharacterized protein n=1 Tax=Daphnia galeata TaxID=27404 RepID=A0A8J2WNX9_9CRUS|nr:unnamed protein product [Daphnia galeata]
MAKQQQQQQPYATPMVRKNEERGRRRCVERGSPWSVSLGGPQQFRTAISAQCPAMGGFGWCTCGFSSVGPGRVEKQPSFPSSSSVDDDLLVKTVLSLKSQLLLSQANSNLWIYSPPFLLFTIR